MEIKTFKIDEFNEAAYNPRQRLFPVDKEFQSLKRSIEEFGYVVPIIINSRTMNIVGGHQRVSVLRELGYDTVECVVVSLDERDEKLLNISLNKIEGKWDYGELGNILLDLTSGDFDATLTGFADSEIDDLLKEFRDTDLLLPDTDAEKESDTDAEKEIKCMIGEFKFTITETEYESAVCFIRQSIGSPTNMMKKELERRLLNG